MKLPFLSRVSERPPAPGEESHAPAPAATPILRAFEGCIEGWSGDEVRGWIVDTSAPNRYVYVCLFINDRFIEKRWACIFRKDIEQRFQSRGLHGFSLRVPHQLLREKELKVGVRLEDHQSFAECTKVLPNPLADEVRLNSARQRARPCLLLLHIPKTAGTALRSALRSDPFTDRQIWLYPGPPGIPLGHLLYLTESQLASLECLIGHFVYGFHNYLPGPSEYATILRHPVERGISLYFHARAKAEDPHHPARVLNMDRYFASAQNGELDNVMVRLLTGKTREFLPPGTVDRGTLEEAIENIHRQFCYVGLQSHLSEAVEDLARRINVAPLELKVENMGEYDRGVTIPQSAIDQIQEVDRYDVELYEYAVRNFWDTGARGWVNAPRG
jgi:hypothetical protein